MNKKVFGKKLSRSRPAREALFATLVKAMIMNGKMVTTRAKAKAVVGSLEKMVTMAKKGDIAARRRALSALDNQREAAEVLFQKVGKAFSARQSGFTRIISLPRRVGDNAQMVRMEWTEVVEYGSKEVVKKAEKKGGESKQTKKEEVKETKATKKAKKVTKK
jgi:large subunit ribosomal protein L17